MVWEMVFGNRVGAGAAHGVPVGLAGVLERGGRLDTAEAEYRHAIALHEKATADFPQEVVFTERLGTIRRQLVELLIDCVIVTDGQVEILNKNLVIATMTEDVPFLLEMVVENGRGYVAAVLVDRDGRVWAGTGGGGFTRVNSIHTDIRGTVPPGRNRIRVLGRSRAGARTCAIPKMSPTINERARTGLAIKEVKSTGVYQLSETADMEKPGASLIEGLAFALTRNPLSFRGACVPE